MKRSIRLLFALVLSLGFSQVSMAQVTAEWSTLGQLRNDYDGHTFVGVTAISEFHVTSGSGYIDLLGSLSGGRTIANNTRDVRMWVEEGRDYEIALSVTFDSNQNASPSTATCFQVTYDAAAFIGPAVHDVKAFARSGPGHYCPTVAHFVSGEVDAFQLNASDGTFADYVRVTWNEIEGANTYRIFRCADEDDNSCGSLIGLVNGNDFDDTEGDSETTYWYRVKSCSPGGCSDFSEADTGYRGEGGSSQPPDTPTGVNATDGTLTDRVRISWNGTQGATRYDVYRCTNNMTSSCGSSLGSAGSTQFDDTGGVSETTYWYRVKACASDMCSAFSTADTGYKGAPVSSEGCDEAFVQLDSETLVINVAPSGIDDTVNIQCALDIAASTGVPTVRLDAGTYYISKVMVENFKGSFEGKTKTATIVEVVDGSIDCDAMNDSGLLAAAIKFVKGEPRIRFMTIRAYMPCAPGFLDAIVHYTGESAQKDNCNNDVIFGVADRVMIEGSPDRTYLRTAIAVEPEGKWLGGCKDTLLGTFKLNRSTILNSYYGIVTSMKAGAQVDINFNEFRDNGHGISLYDGNQNTTITGNKFFGDNAADYNYYGVIVSNFSDSPPPTSRMVVHNNEFNIASTYTDSWSYAVSVRFDLFGASGVISSVSAVVTSNKFNLSGNGTYGVLFRDTSNTHVSSNWFNGSGGRAIFTLGTTPVKGWTMSANMGLANFTSYFVEDIRLGSNTSNCIVGPGQGASILDDGTDNTILPQ